MFFCLFFYIISAKKGLNPQLQDGTLSGDDDGADGNDDDGTWPGPVRCLLGFRNCPTPMCSSRQEHRKGLRDLQKGCQYMYDPLIIRSTSFSSLSAAMPLTASDRTGQGDGSLDIIIMIDGGFHAAIGHPCQILVRSI